ncbi:LD-carboxypeptidase [Pontixanthobacter aestiaquae]|uniref:LD-carboxypeptidase n=1 Tax=Pontixanthobacter aestiaquae TaxID=1509367 RepID=A0A844Z3Z7_9SPHN|nr:LD-carboxypeptidase [Pontixanthobacter aestiaquae]MDN3646567.1 LD-carboxypeptidase [Pontixanthobacter aestiaquae]MXO82448.1 LD-carboxypeptidase [Pontixanthobacter aestiaquae]
MTGRRQVLAGMAAAMAAGIAPVPAFGRRQTKPPRLRSGDRVGLIAPASAVSTRQIDIAQQTIGGMGLVPRLGQNVAGVDGYLAGTDAERAADINAMFVDPSIRAVFAISGGWGCARVLPLLDWDTIRANPKLLVGYSDITALHCAFAARAGFPTMHAPNAANSWQSLSWNNFWWMAFAGIRPVLGGAEDEALTGRNGRTLQGGKAQGRLIGGNLTVISTLMGTPWMPDLKGAILFLEDVAEEPYRIDRMLQQLRLAGVLEKLGGVIFGQCTRCSAPREGDRVLGFTLDEVVDHHLGPLGIPAFAGANIGHIQGQLSVPVGAVVELDAVARTIRAVEAVVA